MSLKRHFAFAEHDVSRCVEEAHPALKRLRISEDVHDGGMPHPDQRCGLLPVAALQPASKEEEQYLAMNALLKQLHTERMQRLQAVAQHHAVGTAPH